MKIISIVIMFFLGASHLCADVGEKVQLNAYTGNITIVGLQSSGLSPVREVYTPKYCRAGQCTYAFIGKSGNVLDFESKVTTTKDKDDNVYSLNIKSDKVSDQEAIEILTALHEHYRIEKEKLSQWKNSISPTGYTKLYSGGKKLGPKTYLGINLLNSFNESKRWIIDVTFQWD